MDAAGICDLPNVTLASGEDDLEGGGRPESSLRRYSNP